LKRVKDAGFDGVEAGGLPPLEAEACRKVAEKCGMRIHSVMRGWAEFNSTDADSVAQKLTITEDALRAALDQIGYHGWLTIEGGDLSTTKHSERLDLIIIGK
jgi:sugar phosphate isomerase/epimerase